MQIHHLTSPVIRIGDQIIEWNGVNLCNRSNEEVQQILLSQFSDDEVEIVYLPRSKFQDAYGDLSYTCTSHDSSHLARNLVDDERDIFDKYADLNRPGHIHSLASADGSKGGIRRKLSLSSIAQMWSR